MRQMRIKILILIAVALLGSACSVNKKISEANNSFSRKEYFAASEKYRLVNRKIKDRLQKPPIYFKLAESYRRLGEYSKAAIWYKNAIRTGYKDSLVELLYADALRAAEKTDDAKSIYESELKKDPKNKWASNGLESIRLIQEWKDIPELYQIENMRSVNSFANDLVVQISPQPNQSICLRSSRETIPEKKINPETGQKYGGIFTSDLSLIHISEPTRLGMISYAVFCLQKKNKK